MRVPIIEAMNKRLVWNFEFCDTETTPLTGLRLDKKDLLKWEVRYFWPEKQTIVLNTIDKSLLDLLHYQRKSKQDYYYLIPGKNYNIKHRRNQLLYKPMLQQSNVALGYGRKIDLESLHEASHEETDLEHILHLAKEQATEIYVQKESFTFTFPTTPSIKLELARLEVHNKIYFSACIEGRSLYWVETISEALLGKQTPCDYVSFLNKIQRS